MATKQGEGQRCRELRERARVPLSAMARRLHRDPSSLSRFERGQSVPRDLTAVVTAYEALEPVPAETLTHTRRHTIMLLAWFGVRWAILAILLLLGDGHQEMVELRWFLAFNSTALAVLVGYKTLPRFPAMFCRGALPLVIAVVYAVDPDPFDLWLMAAWVTWVECGFVGWARLTIGLVNERGGQARAVRLPGRHG